MKLPSPSRISIILYPDPVLKKRAANVAKFNAELAALAKRMLDLMREAKGVGLAAPQVGVGLRVFVCNPTGEPGDDLICINPRFTELTGGEDREEGCLSIPDYLDEVERPERVKVRFLDLEGTKQEIEADGLLARVVQHEIDHINGVLFIDHLSKLKRSRVIKKFAKAAKREAVG